MLLKYESESMIPEIVGICTNGFALDARGHFPRSVCPQVVDVLWSSIRLSNIVSRAVAFTRNQLLSGLLKIVEYKLEICRRSDGSENRSTRTWEEIYDRQSRRFCIAVHVVDMLWSSLRLSNIVTRTASFIEMWSRTTSWSITNDGSSDWLTYVWMLLVQHDYYMQDLACTAKQTYVAFEVAYGTKFGLY